MSNPTEQGFALTATRRGRRWTLVPIGELDIASGRQLVDVATRLAAGEAPVVDLELGRISFVDSSGWEAVTRVQELLSTRRHRCRLVGGSPAVDHLLSALRRSGEPCAVRPPESGATPARPATLQSSSAALTAGGRADGRDHRRTGALCGASVRAARRRRPLAGGPGFLPAA